MSQQVTAYTFADDDRELPPRQVTGVLKKRYIPVLDYTQHTVDGVLVDPDTVELVTNSNDCHDERGRFCSDGGSGPQDEISVFGKYSAGSVIRWMRKEGFDFKRSKAALASVGVKVADSTLMAGLTRKKISGEPANLTDSEKEMLKQHLSAPTATAPVVGPAPINKPVPIESPPIQTTPIITPTNFGKHSNNSILLWMRSEGFTFKQARAAFDTIGLKAADSSIMAGLTRKNMAGDAAKLTDVEKAVLRSHLSPSQQKQGDTQRAAIASPATKAKWGDESEEQLRSRLEKKWHDDIDSQPHLLDHNKTLFKEAFSTVLSNMTEQCLKRLDKGVNKIEWFNNTSDLTEYRNHPSRSDLPQAPKLPPGHIINGVYYRDQRTVLLDGTTNKYDAPGFQGDTHNITGTYAHELGHAIDAGGKLYYELSGIARDGKSWSAAWEREIGMSGTTVRLSGYGQTSTTEGFAEFSRLLYGTRRDMSEVERRFPSCLAFFKRNGLWK